MRAWQGRTMVDRDADRIGEIQAIHVDDSVDAAGGPERQTDPLGQA